MLNQTRTQKYTLFYSMIMKMKQVIFTLAHLPTPSPVHLHLAPRWILQYTCKDVNELWSHDKLYASKPNNFENRCMDHCVSQVTAVSFCNFTLDLNLQWHWASQHSQHVYRLPYQYGLASDTLVKEYHATSPLLVLKDTVFIYN